MDKNLLVLEYQDNFLDNFSTYAYGKIIETRYQCKCCYENSTNEREKFENTMSNFNLDYSYVSKSRAEEISKKSKYMDYRDFKHTFIKKDSSISIPYFKISDIDLIDDKIKSELNFKSTDFLKNYDILEEIISTNSIGLYISNNDIPDNKYIINAVTRLNKYIKKPILYVFGNQKINVDDLIECKYCNLSDDKEEFYFLKSCKHKIIHCTKSSYSEGFWSSVLGRNDDFNYIIYSNKVKCKNHHKNWIGI